MGIFEGQNFVKWVLLIACKTLSLKYLEYQNLRSSISVGFCQLCGMGMVSLALPFAPIFKLINYVFINMTDLEWYWKVLSLMGWKELDSPSSYLNWLGTHLTLTVREGTSSIPNYNIFSAHVKLIWTRNLWLFVSTCMATDPGCGGHLWNVTCAFLSCKILMLFKWN